MTTLGRMLLIGVLSALAAAPLLAHKGHALPSPSPAAAVEAPETTLVAEAGEASAAAEDSAGDSGDRDGDRDEPGVMEAIPWQTAFTGHLHNKIVHFPLAFGLAAAAIFIVAPRWPAYEPAA